LIVVLAVRGMICVYSVGAFPFRKVRVSLSLGTLAPLNVCVLYSGFIA
jgi:hypothetical protein